MSVSVCDHEFTLMTIPPKCGKCGALAPGEPKSTDDKAGSLTGSEWAHYVTLLRALADVWKRGQEHMDVLGAEMDRVCNLAKELAELLS